MESNGFSQRSIEISNPFEMGIGDKLQTAVYFYNPIH